MATSDGAGVKLARSLGQGGQQRLDPFLMLDEFGSENPGDYIAGFPPHPHRGFETVTYMLDGHMQHKDHLGNVGELRSGGVQWMTAARGIIHSEMPQQEQGRMRGFQLWINLPAAEKMKPPSYRDIQSDAIPEVDLGGVGTVRVIAGDYVADGVTTAGPIRARRGRTGCRRTTTPSCTCTRAASSWAPPAPRASSRNRRLRSCRQATAWRRAQARRAHGSSFWPRGP
jgi:redox-sensitive bicupin YhaK (pirin superfamily)